MDGRSNTRLVVDQETRCVINGRVERVFLYNLSASGCMLETDRFVVKGSSITISLGEFVDATGEVVWRSGCNAGVRFLEPINEAVVRFLGFNPPSHNFDEIEPRDRFGRVLAPLRDW